MADGEIIKTTKIADRWRISLVVSVRELFESQGRPVEIGDRVVYRLVDDKVIVEPAKGSDHL